MNAWRHNELVIQSIIRELGQDFVFVDDNARPNRVKLNNHTKNLEDIVLLLEIWIKNLFIH